METALIDAEKLFFKMGYKQSKTYQEVLYLDPTIPVDFKSVISVAFDCLLASVECYLLAEIRNEVGKKFPVTCEEVVDFRFRHTGTLDNCILEMISRGNQNLTNTLPRGLADSSVVVASGATMMQSVDKSSSRRCGSLRPIVIDGSNVAMHHGQWKKEFSVRGIELVVRYFEARGHEKIVAFVPEFRKKFNQTNDKRLLDQLEKEQKICFTPSRKVGRDRVTSYDDRFILDYAAQHGGIVVTRDHYTDLIKEKLEWREVIEKRILQQTFVCGDDLMFPHDPLGRGGPNLDQFLRF